MRFNVLGPLVVDADDGSDATPRGAQPRKLLTALVAAAPDPVPVDALNELLWPAESPTANALQSQISKLRRALPGLEIAAERRGYALLPGPADSVDIVEFEALVRAGRHAADAGRHGDTVSSMTAALGLIRGEPLEDLAGSELGRAPSARLAALVTTARSALIEAEMAEGHVGEAAAELEELVATEPLDEHWWALLMTAHYRQGRQADALRTFQQARRILADELGLEPGPELRELERQILAQDNALLGSRDEGTSPTARTGPRVAPIPARLTSLIGRDKLLVDVAAEAARSRLVTLVGPGGAGKTSVALTLARRAPEGTAVFVTLAALDEPDAVPSAVAATLGLAAEGGVTGTPSSTTDRVIDALTRERMLLVLDNCEHLIDAAAKLVHRLLESCPLLSVLATSREPLGVPGEVARAVPPLTEHDAESLFVERAVAAAPDFAPEPQDRAVIAAICARLDGLPLAIELAAACVRAMHPSELLARLDDRFAVLASGPRTVEPRQQTLRAVVDWSHDLLDDAEKAVFRRLAAFSGGATLASAEVVCSDSELVPTQAVRGIVARLIDKSLLVVDRRSSPVRYWMLQTLADYTKERLRESGEVEYVSDRHAHHFADLVAPALRGLLGRDQARWLDVLTVERENLRVALEVAVARGDANLALRLTAPTGWYYYMVAQHDAGRAALEDALACPGPADPALRALVLAHYSWLAANGPNITDALDASAAAIDLLAAVDDPWLEAFVYTARILTTFFAGRLDEVRGLYPPMADAAQRSGDRWAKAIASLLRAEIAIIDGDVATSRSGFHDAITLFEAVGDEFSLSIALAEASERSEMSGDYDHAVALLARSIEMGERVGFSPKPHAVRARLANVEALRGNLELAERLHRGLLAEFTDDSLPWVQAMSCCGLAMVCRRSGRPEEATQWLERAWTVSRSREVPVMQALVHIGLGYSADQRGDHEAALAHQLEGLETTMMSPIPRAIANSLEGVAGALAAGARPELAARLLGAADALRRRTGGPMPAGERFDVDRAERRARDALGDAAFDAAFKCGSVAPVDDVVEEALALR